jgi:hypothetical protein
MHKHTFPTQLLLIVLLIGGSCAPVYVPTKNNVPLLAGKGELQTYIGAGVGFNAQAAYALTDNIGVAANYLYVKSSGRDNDTNRFKHQAGELALGYYKNIRPDLCFEVYAGLGLGKGNAEQIGDVFSSTISANSKYNKFFIQPAVGSTEKWLRWNVSLKCSLVDFTSIHVKESGDPEITSVSPKLFLTPAVTTAYDFWNGRVSASLQVGANAHIGSRTGFHYFALVSSVGLTYKIKSVTSNQ